MLTATYAGAASPWTQAIDDALRLWSPFVVGEANFRIEVRVEPIAGTTIAHLTALSSFKAGKTIDGETVRVPSALARLQGVDSGNTDFLITIDSGTNWSMSGPESGKYDLLTLMIHEVGHALGVLPLNDNAPWEMDNHLHRADEFHLADPGAIMFPWFYEGVPKTITPADVAAISSGGAPTALDDTIYVVGPRVDGGAGHDTAIWLGSFNSFTASLTNIETLSLRGADPLTTHQADVYRLYDAAFNRNPDLAGFTWWAGSGLDANAIAANFAASAEFAALYNGDRSAIVTALYRNVLDREPDADGLAYWVGSAHDSAAMLIGFALAPENALGPVEFTLA
jgi:hypothetical protein